VPGMTRRVSEMAPEVRNDGLSHLLSAVPSSSFSFAGFGKGCKAALEKRFFLKGQPSRSQASLRCVVTFPAAELPARGWAATESGQEHSACSSYPAPTVSVHRSSKNRSPRGTLQARSFNKGNFE
jgi:hypothetical protein